MLANNTPEVKTHRPNDTKKADPYGVGLDTKTYCGLKSTHYFGN